MRQINIIFVVVMLAGCTAVGQSSTDPKLPAPMPAPDPIVQPSPPGPLPPSTRPIYNLAGYPAAAREGYIDGCETAKRTAYGSKDDERYKTDEQYRMGWDDGFSICRSVR